MNDLLPTAVASHANKAVVLQMSSAKQTAAPALSSRDHGIFFRNQIFQGAQVNPRFKTKANVSFFCLLFGPFKKECIDCARFHDYQEPPPDGYEKSCASLIAQNAAQTSLCSNDMFTNAKAAPPISYRDEEQ
jgi:hypothetical protein